MRYEANTYNIGWLQGGKDIPREQAPPLFVENLWEYIPYPFHESRGIHSNEALDGAGCPVFTIYYGGYGITLGSAEIRVIDTKYNCVYAAPNLILHYVIDHNYLPPKRFIDAVMTGPKPGSEEYRNYIIEYYKDERKSPAPSLVCPYCEKSNWTFLFARNGVYDKSSGIKIIKTDLSDEKEEYREYYYNDGGDDRRYYRVLCEDCGRVFMYNYDSEADRERDRDTYYIGWLEGEKDIPRGEAPPLFLENLWKYIIYPFQQNRLLGCKGVLDCDGHKFTVIYDGYEFALGGAEIRVIDTEHNCVYVAPNMILHYIIDHNYLPPKRFIDAVMSGPKPGLQEYKDYIVECYKEEEASSYSGIVCPCCKESEWTSIFGRKKVYEKSNEIIITEKEPSNEPRDIMMLCTTCGNVFKYK